MAKHLANLVAVHGTERDRVNCPFYYKMGACRHGERCSRLHNKPLSSTTLLLTNMYYSPAQIRATAAAAGLPPPTIPKDEETTYFDNFYVDVWREMAKYGRVDELHVCENLSDHLAGNTYVKFAEEDSAAAALAALESRWYAGRPVKADLSPVTHFREARCRPYEKDACDRGDYCNFMHLCKLSDRAHRQLFDRRRRGAKAPPPSRSPPRRRGPARDGSREWERDAERGSEREREWDGERQADTDRGVGRERNGSQEMDVERLYSGRRRREGDMRDTDGGERRGAGGGRHEEYPPPRRLRRTSGHDEGEDGRRYGGGSFADRRHRGEPASAYDDGRRRQDGYDGRPSF